MQTKFKTVGKLKAGDVLVVDGAPKTVHDIQKASASGYLIAVFTDGTWKAMGHKLGQTLVVVQ